MATLTKIELEVLSEIADSIESSIRILGMDNTDKDKLAYLTCLNDEEKHQYTRQEISKLQKDFQNCSATISPYLFGLIQQPPSDTNIDYYKKEKTIIEGFFLSEYDEAFQLLSAASKDIEEWRDDFREFLVPLGFKFDELDEFILYMSKGGRYLNLVSFLPNSNLPKSPLKELQLLNSFNVTDFFNEIADLEITQIEIYNTVEKITDNFNLEKLKILHNDFDLYLFNRKEERLAECTDDEIFAAINELKSKNKEIPYKTINIPVKLPSGKWEKQKGASQLLDLEKLLYPYEFFTCYKFGGFLKDKIFEISSINTVKLKEPNQIKIQSFKYKGSQRDLEKLTYLFNDLKSNKFISYDTELKHFRKIFGSESIEKKIVWIGNISELFYFIKQLHNIQKKVEDLKQKQWEVAIHCFMLPNGKQINRTKLRLQKKPASASKIEKMIKAL